MYRTLLVIGLAACGAANGARDDGGFEIRRIEVGHATASVLVLDPTPGVGPGVALTGGEGVTVLRWRGTGGLDVVERIPAGAHPVQAAGGDVDEDGHRDLVVANHDTDYLTLVFGGPSGLGSGRSERFVVDVSPHPHAVAVADVDEDGHLDIVTDDRDRERLVVYRGGGDGSFEAGEPIAVGGDPYRGMSLIDLDDDGHLDVLTPNPRSVAIQLGDGAGRFSPAPSLESAGMPPFSTRAADFNGDGVLDVAAGSGEGAGGVVLWFGNGDGTFERDPDSPYPIADGPTALGSGDVDGDGIDDLLVTSYLGNEVAILSVGPDGTRVVRIELDDYPWGVAAADLDGDGRTDLMVANDGGTRVTALLRR